MTKSERPAREDGTRSELRERGSRSDSDLRERDSRSDSDLRELGDRIASLAAQIDASTHKLLTMLAEFDREGGWKTGGHGSCAHWLSWRTGVDIGAARERVRAARALEHLPKTSEAMSRGQLSYSKARAITRVATEENEGELLSLAMTGSVAKVERVVRSWKRHSRLDELELERLRHESRTLSVFPDEEGMYLIRGRLDPEVGALLMRAIDAATDELYKAETPEERKVRQPRQRRADAMGLLAERALATPSPGSGSRADHFQVTLHVDADTVSEDREPGTSELEDGTRVSAETSRRVSCDASLVVVKHGQDGSILDVGRKRRTVPPSLRRALRARDRGCRYPGCGNRFTEGHHVRHWADGGGTSLRNLVSLCRRHHRAVHEEGCRVVMGPAGRAEFYGADGVLIPEVAGELSSMGQTER